ncbi:MAG: Uma2 family endonuclease [Isosphaeraceae bacterium]
MSTIISPAPPQAIVYPDSDGKPMAENTLQFRWIVTIEGGLEALYRNDANVFVAGDLLWYAIEGNPKIRTAPDAMVVFGRPKGRRGSYKQWEEGGIAPQVVFEVLSPGNRFGEMLRKFRFYERHGVDEYYIYNPDSGSLEGYLRAKRALKAIPKMNGFVSPRLGIRFEPGEGPDNLVIVGPDGRRFSTYVQLIGRVESADERAEVERARADEQAQRAEAERRRADEQAQLAARLAARLRELGIEPE